MITGPLGKILNVAVAAYVTTDARFKIYENLRDLRMLMLYCDTDYNLHPEGR
jgi:hypothetical protein